MKKINVLIRLSDVNGTNALRLNKSGLIAFRNDTPTVDLALIARATEILNECLEIFFTLKLNPSSTRGATDMQKRA